MTTEIKEGEICRFVPKMDDDDEDFIRRNRGVHVKVIRNVREGGEVGIRRVDGKSFEDDREDLESIARFEELEPVAWRINRKTRRFVL